MTSEQLNKIAMIAGGIAFVFCLAGGAWILTHVDVTDKEDALWTGIGLYFIGKAFFVGPMLLVAAGKGK